MRPAHDAGAGTGAGAGHGKLLLCGEHAVVHGHPAIALAVDRGTRVAIRAQPGPTVIDSPHADARVREALLTVVPAEGWSIGVRTDLPVGRGMGSSAALAVALVRAHADLDRDPIDADEAYRRAMPIERAFHGNPSGVDVAVAARGGTLWFRRGDPPERTSLPAPPWSVVVLDSGTAGDTAALVAAVAARRPQIDPVLDRIGELVAAARDVLDDPAAIGALIDENHAHLREIGVSTDALDALVALARRAGAHGAKLAGAGGGRRGDGGGRRARSDAARGRGGGRRGVRGEPCPPDAGSNGLGRVRRACARAQTLPSCNGAGIAPVPVMLRRGPGPQGLSGCVSFRVISVAGGRSGSKRLVGAVARSSCDQRGRLAKKMRSGACSGAVVRSSSRPRWKPLISSHHPTAPLPARSSYVDPPDRTMSVRRPRTRRFDPDLPPATETT